MNKSNHVLLDLFVVAIVCLVIYFGLFRPEPSSKISAALALASNEPGSAAPDGSEQAHIKGTPVATETETPSPTATIGYQATALIAQAQASTAQADLDAANRLMVAATQTHEGQIFIQQSWTATADEFKRQADQATAQALPTFIPPTQTQQAFVMAAIATNQNLSMTAQSMTLTAPTQIAAIAEAQTAARMAPINAWISVFAIGALGLFLISISVWLLRRPMTVATGKTQPDPKPASAIYQESAGVHVTVHNDDPQFPSSHRVVIPCTEEQLTELADGLIYKHLSLAVNLWEGSGKPFTRNTFYRMRNFLQQNRLARSNGRGELVLLAEGESLFRGWLENKKLPHLFTITQEINGITRELIHVHENHTHETPGGVVFKPISSGEKTS